MAIRLYESDLDFPSVQLIDLPLNPVRSLERRDTLPSVRQFSRYLKPLS